MNKTERETRSVREFAQALKRFLGPCKDCGTAHNLTWDHVRGEKIMSVSRAAHQGYLELVIVEAQKCEVVCVWCHDRREYQRGRNGPLESYDFIRLGGMTPANAHLKRAWAECAKRRRREQPSKPAGVRPTGTGGSSKRPPSPPPSPRPQKP